MAKKKYTSSVKSNLRENTREMYENTLREMKDRGASEADIKLVEQARDEALAAYDYVPTEEDKELKTPIADSGYKGFLNRILSVGYLRENFEPLLDNLFLVHVGELPIFVVKAYGTNYDEKVLRLTAFETAGFSPEVYFSENKKFDSIKVEFLNPVGAVIRTETFEKVKVVKVEGRWLSYYSNGAPVETYINFKYKRHNVCTTSKEERTVSETKVEDSKKA